MVIQDLYKRFNLMPQLITHQLRVGGIVTLVAQDFLPPEEARIAVLSALVHDLGNIVKFDLTKSYLQNGERSKWEEVQSEQRRQYGKEAHQATYAMLQEAGLGEYVTILKDEGRAYDRTDLDREFFESMSKPALLTLYGDMRVSIEGVCSMAERIADLTRRYGGVRPETMWGEKLEDYIAELSPRARLINEAQVGPFFDELLTMTV